MSQGDSLKSFYDERATLAHTMEHEMRNKTVYTLEKYGKLQADIYSLEVAFAQTWRRPRFDTVQPLPWCSICGRNDRARLPGSMLCAICEDVIQAGTITQGEHAEAPRREE